MSDEADRAPAQTDARPSEAETGSRLRGILLMSLAVACFAVLDGCAKWLGRDLPPVQVTFARYAVAFVIITAVLNPITNPRAWSTRRPVMQIVRGLALFGSTLFNFKAIQTLQLAETITIGFATPFLIALLAGPMLGERIDRTRWIAILVGFSGVLIVTRPGADGFAPGVLWSIGSVACYAFYSIATRVLSKVDSSASMLVISALIPTAILAPVMPGVWISPASWHGWALMGVLGLSGAIGHFFLIRAYTNAPAPVVAPFIYTQIIWTTLVGYLVFGDLPGFYTILGACVVVGSGLFLLLRETRSGGRETG